MRRPTRTLLTLTCAALLLATGLTAQKTESAQALLRAAADTAVVDGDLKRAIAQYQTIVDTFKTDRAVVATALVRMAECYEKLGDAQARAIYEQLVRDYADQTNAVTLARTRLGGPDRGARSGIALRKVWDSQNVDGLLQAISPDGRLLSYSEGTRGHLTLRDLVVGTDRLLTNEPDNYFYVFGSRISRDGTQIAYSWNIPGPHSQRYMLRIASLQGTGLPPSRLLFDREDISEVDPKDWSPDGKSIAAVLSRKDRTHQIALVAVQDGSVRVLKSMDWRAPSAMFFSPDGRDLAFDLPVGDTDANRDVFVLAVDASREIAAVEHPSRDTLMGWSPDGKYLLFGSDRSNGSMGLWAQPFAERRASGPPTPVKPDIGNARSLGMTSAGRLYLESVVSNSDIEVASIDFETGKPADRSVRPVQEFVGSNTMPAWSPDGKYLAYASQRPNSALILGIRSLETGAVKEVRPALRYINSFSWAPDGRSFAVAGADEKGRQGVYRLDAQTGEAAPIVLTPTGRAQVSYTPQWSPDGTHLYYRRNLDEGRAFVERDVASGREREVIRGHLGAIRTSPDGRWIATTNQWAAVTRSTVLLIPIEGGEPRELLQVNKSVNHPGLLEVQGWTADSRGVIVRKYLTERSDASELWIVPISGAAPLKLDLDASHISNGYQPLGVHPDGRRLVFVSGRQTHEAWVLENFLPAQAAKR